MTISLWYSKWSLVLSISSSAFFCLIFGNIVPFKLDQFLNISSALKRNVLQISWKFSSRDEYIFPFTTYKRILSIVDSKTGSRSQGSLSARSCTVMFLASLLMAISSISEQHSLSRLWSTKSFFILYFMFNSEKLIPATKSNIKFKSDIKPCLQFSFFILVWCFRGIDFSPEFIK